MGTRRTRHQDRPRARAHRPDGARVRLGACDERRRHSSTTSRWRSVRLDVGRRGRGARPGQFGMADETGRVLNDAIVEGRREGLGLGQAVCGVSRRRRPHCSRRQSCCAAARLRRSRHRSRRASARTSFTCIPTRPARRSAPAACATSATSRRSSPRLEGGVYLELRVRRDPARGVPEGRGARAQPRDRAGRADDGQLRLRASVSARDQRRPPTRRRDRHAAIP